ncbi:MAG: hypothetical protein KGY61_07190 [Desulfobacterales bacterium]|nr:hypothetical protein [Desulfobacterales bacterium]
MFRDQVSDISISGFAIRELIANGSDMSDEGLQICERIKEIMMMCDREDPVYEQISSFSIALYTLGYFDSPDLMSFQDVDAQEAAAILKEHFMPVNVEAVPWDYHITQSDEKYLLVIGDPLFPLHFAVLTDFRNERPYFSKLPLFGSGFDSLPELMDEFSGYDGVRQYDVHYFKKNQDSVPPQTVRKGRIYIVRD